ncbi:MAG: hypothetical protein KUG58_08205 [Marinosulfonomonas sp.]|nr:hypothetical protein [Marinosulfonomonas sp.]
MKYLEKKQHFELSRQSAVQLELLRELKFHNQAIERLQESHLAHFEFANSTKNRLEQQKSYNAVVLAIGYAGFFALWAFLKDLLPDRATSLTAILVGFSLLVYVFWEIGIAASNTFDIIHSENDLGRSSANKVYWPEKLFPYVWVLTTASGLAGTVILFYNAIAHFCQLPMWPS